jgi:uncharacterized surface protein with fasciclin (FAS1) repeats
MALAATDFVVQAKGIDMNRKSYLVMVGTLAVAMGTAVVLPARMAHAQMATTAPSTDKKDIIETATGPGMEQVTTVVKAIEAAGLVDTLKGAGPFTVFAPTNDAFAALPPGTVDDLLKPENKEKLKDILLYHVHVGDAIDAKDCKTMELSTAEGAPLHIKVDGDMVMVNDAKVIKADIHCSNGVIHWVDKVLMPPAK